MMTTQFDFHLMDQKISATLRDEEYCSSLKDSDTLYWIPFLSFPITQSCNFKCIYCGVGGEATASEKKLISIKDIENVVSIASSKGIRKFRITGGEPFTHPDIDRILEMMSDFGFFTLINTNGSLITKHSHVIQKLNTNLHFAVSFDTLQPNLLKSISGVSCHSKIVDGIKLLKSFSLLMRLNTVVTTLNIKEIPDIINFCKELNCDLKLLDVVSVPVPFGKRNTIYQEISSLEASFAKQCDEILFHEYTRGFGTPCRRYRFGNVYVTIKNSVKGSHYDRRGTDAICAHCPYFPCHEGLYDIFALSDGRICSCRWTEQQRFTNISDQIDYLITAFRRSEYVNTQDNGDMKSREDLVGRITRE